MKVINAGYSIIDPDLDDPEQKEAKRIYKKLERIGRICYQSDVLGTDESAENFIRRLINRVHEAMLEHAFMTVIFTVDRGVSHEIVRHRLASFAQESTRYCNYSQGKFGNEITVIRPFYLNGKEFSYDAWVYAMEEAENQYFNMLNDGCTPQEARAVLPNSLKTEIAVTANMREWRHILKLRAAGTTGKPHPQMLEVMVPLLNELREKMPVLFDDIIPMVSMEDIDKE